MHAGDELRKLSDEELVEKARLHGLRRALYVMAGPGGCLLAVSGLFVGFVAGFGFLGFWWLIPTVFLIMPLSAALMMWSAKQFERIAVGDVAPYVHELNRRFGLLTPEEYLADEQAAPDLRFSVLVDGRVLPRGNDYFARLRVPVDGAPLLRAWTAKDRVDWVHGKHPREFVTMNERALDEQEAADMDALLGALAWGEAENVDNLARGDRFPCVMAVIDHAGDARYALTCNLKAAPEAVKGVRLLQRTMQLAFPADAADESASE